MQVYGIDLSKDKFDVNFIDVDGKQKNKVVKNALVSISKFLSTIQPGGRVMRRKHWNLRRLISVLVQSI